MKNTPNSNTIHPDLVKANEIAYETSDLICKNLVKEAANEKYGACGLEIKKLSII